MKGDEWKKYKTEIHKCSICGSVEQYTTRIDQPHFYEILKTITTKEYGEINFLERQFRSNNKIFKVFYIRLEDKEKAKKFIKLIGSKKFIPIY